MGIVFGSVAVCTLNVSKMQSKNFSVCHTNLGTCARSAAVIPVPAGGSDRGHCGTRGLH